MQLERAVIIARALLASLFVGVPVGPGNVFATANQTLEHFASLRPSNEPQAEYLRRLQVRCQFTTTCIVLLAVIT